MGSQYHESRMLIDKITHHQSLRLLIRHEICKYGRCKADEAIVPMREKLFSKIFSGDPTQKELVFFSSKTEE